MMRSLLESLKGKPLLFGHRGASGEYPENTILSFEMAFQQGALGVETDLQYSKDQHIVCFHDKYLARLTRQTGSIGNSSVQELSKARIKHERYPDQPIPTLVDLLEWLPKDKCAMLELKDPQFSRADKMGEFINTLAKYDLLDRVILASFRSSNLEQAKSIFASVVTCYITPYRLSPNPKADISAPFFPILFINRGYARDVHMQRKYVSVWDNHPEKRLDYYLAQKIDVITSNQPWKVVEALTKIVGAGM